MVERHIWSAKAKVQIKLDFSQEFQGIELPKKCRLGKQTRKREASKATDLLKRWTDEGVTAAFS